MSKITTIFACRFRTVLKERKVKQKDFAEQSGFNINSVHRWANAKAQPSVEQLTTIAKLLDVSTDYLCGLTREFKALSDLLSDSVTDDADGAETADGAKVSTAVR